MHTGYHSDNTNLTSNTLTFEVAITMLDHDYNTTDPYTVGFTLWKKDPTSVEIMWSAQETVQAVNESLDSLVCCLLLWAGWLGYTPTLPLTVFVAKALLLTTA